MTNEDYEPWPADLIVKEGGSLLHVIFDNGDEFALTAEYLRVESPSAEVKGHGPGQEVTVGGKKNIKIINIEPVGNYAVRLTFDDMHNSGIYSWSFLYRLGAEGETIWQNYLEKLEKAGLSRG